MGSAPDHYAPMAPAGPNLNNSAFTPSQIAQYLTHIGLPPSLYHPSLATPSPTLNATYLTTLFTHHITTFPFEDLAMHYAPPPRTVSLSPAALFNKMVIGSRSGDTSNDQGTGRGGYCMEGSILFNHALRGLGFKDVYLAPARARARDMVRNLPAGPFLGWRHVVNIVTLEDGRRFALDVAYGGDGPTVPMPMWVEGHGEAETVHGGVGGIMLSNGIGMQEVRLVRFGGPPGTPGEKGARSDTVVGSVAGEGGEDSRRQPPWWVYEYRNGKDKPWHSCYTFSEFAWSESDFEALNWWVQTSSQCFLTTTVMVVKFMRGWKPWGDGGTEGEEWDIGEDADSAREEQRQQALAERPGRVCVAGKIMLVHGDVKKNVAGKTELVQRCETEEERIVALRDHLGIVLTREEIEGIRGMDTELGRLPN